LFRLPEIIHGPVDDELRRKRYYLEYLLPFIRPSIIAELGCGSGFVAECVEQRLTEGMIIGVDRDAGRLASLKSIPATHALCGDIRTACLRDESVDTALIISTLHEVYSESGKDGIANALSSAARALKYGGRLILYDRVRSGPRRVMIDFTDPDLRIRFDRFFRDFNMRDIEYIEEGSKILSDIDDAFEFIEKFALETGNGWYDKLGETDLFFSQQEYAVACLKAGLKIVNGIIWKEQRGTPEELIDRMIIDVNYSRSWIGLVVEKVAPTELDAPSG